MADADFPAEPIALVLATTDVDARAPACEAYPLCNAVIHMGAGGDCYIKSIGTAIVETVELGIATAQRLRLPVGSICGVPMPGIDLIRNDIGSIGGIANVEDCAAGGGQNFAAPCNAAVWIKHA